jgi:hypothetical protein
VRRACASLLLAAALATGSGCGSSSSSPDAKRTTSVDPFSVVPTQPADSAVARRRAAPHWETVARLAGSGPATRSFTVARGAIQWRVRWRCTSGTLRLSAAGAARRRTIATASCPRSGTRSDVRPGRVALGVQTPGRWRVVVEQQVDTALHEPPLAAMRAPGARVVARGRFYDVERFGRGDALLYRLPSGRLALRLDAFVTSANVDLHVWISRAARPRTTVQAGRAPHDDVALLKSTLGDQNYLLPAGTTPADVRSVVIWCEPIQIAYTAAALRP